MYEYVKPLIDESLQGFTVTIFAFGMTGSGKTHTISGGEEDMGILPRSVQHVFDSLRRKSTESPDKVSMVCLTYVELYNNNLNDLLGESASACYDGEGSTLKIHEHPKLGIYLTGSPGIRTPVSSPEECMAMIQKGNKTRATGSTNLNERSSRSHTVITLEIITREVGDASIASEGIVSVGKLNLVDLAGSERVKLSGASGQTLEEAKQINKALSVLGDVLNSLGKYHQSLHSSDYRVVSPPHIPYRNSKLTMLLKDSLGGNSKTMMLTTIRKSRKFLQQTDMSLKYAARAKHIRNIPTQNIGIEESSGNNGAVFMRKTLEEVARLKGQLHVRSREYEELKSKLDLLEKESAGNKKSKQIIDMEENYRSQIALLTQQNENGKKELQEHLSMLVHSHNSVLARKDAESQVMETKLREHASTIESLSREKKAATIHQHKAHATVQELYRKIAQGQADYSYLENENQKLHKELKVVSDRMGELELEKEKFLAAIKKLMDSRQKHKVRVAELESKLTEWSIKTEEKSEEIEKMKSQYIDEREESERNFANTIAILKESEDRINALVLENLELKERVEVEYEKSRDSTNSDNSVNDKSKGVSETPAEELPPTDSKRIVNSKEVIIPTQAVTNPETMKKDRLQVENVALRQKIRLMVEEEKYMIKQLETKTKELNETREKVLKLEWAWNSDTSERQYNQISKEEEYTELETTLFTAERRIEDLENQLRVSKARNEELSVMLHRKNGVISLERNFNETLKQSLERARKENGDELKRAITLMKSHVSDSSDGQEMWRRHKVDIVSLASDDDETSSQSSRNHASSVKAAFTSDSTLGPSRSGIISNIRSSLRSNDDEQYLVDNIVEDMEEDSTEEIEGAEINDSEVISEFGEKV